MHEQYGEIVLAKDPVAQRLLRAFGFEGAQAGSRILVGKFLVDGLVGSFAMQLEEADGETPSTAVPRGAKLASPGPSILKRGASSASLSSPASVETPKARATAKAKSSPASGKKTSPPPARAVPPPEKRVPGNQPLPSKASPPSETEERTPPPRGSSCADSSISPLGATRDPSKDCSNLCEQRTCETGSCLLMFVTVLQYRTWTRLSFQMMSSKSSRSRRAAPVTMPRACRRTGLMWMSIWRL